MIRNYMPDAALTTDIIVGFPGETDSEFLETMNFVQEIGFSRLHVFKYSPRKGTPAAAMPNQIPGDIKNARSEQLIALGEILTKRFHANFDGRIMPVLYEEIGFGKHIMEGYTTNYIRVKSPSQKSLVGDIIDTRISAADSSYMKGILI